MFNANQNRSIVVLFRNLKMNQGEKVLTSVDTRLMISTWRSGIRDN